MARSFIFFFLKSLKIYFRGGVYIYIYIVELVNI